MTNSYILHDNTTWFQKGWDAEVILTRHVAGYIYKNQTKKVYQSLDVFCIQLNTDLKKYLKII